MSGVKIRIKGKNGMAEKLCRSFFYSYDSEEILKISKSKC